MIDRYRQSALTGRRKPVNGWRRSLVPLLRSSSQRWVAWRCKMSRSLVRIGVIPTDTYNGRGITILILIYRTRIDNVVSDNARDRRVDETKSVICINYCDDKYRGFKRGNECIKWRVSGISPSKCDSVSEIMGSVIHAHYQRIAWFKRHKRLVRFCATNNFIAFILRCAGSDLTN